MRMVFGLVLIAGLALAGFAVYMAKGFIRGLLPSWALLPSSFFYVCDL